MKIQAQDSASPVDTPCSFSINLIHRIFHFPSASLDNTISGTVQVLWAQISGPTL